MEISVVIPSYNHGRYIRTALDSVLRQTRPVQEIIIVDDGSTDDTRSQIPDTDARIRYVYQPNSGLSNARNVGVQAARCSWVAFLDADDWWHEDKIRLQVEHLSRDPEAVLAYTSMNCVFSPERQELVRAVPAEDVWPALRMRNCITGSGSAVLARRDVLIEAGGFNERLTACEDWDLWVRLAAKHRFVAVPEATTFIRRLPGSMSADQDRMIAQTERILESTLLHGLSGIARWVWRRKIRASGYYSAATMCAPGGPSEQSYILQSLRQWPFPDVRPERWIMAARMCLGKRGGQDLGRRGPVGPKTGNGCARQIDS